MTDLAEPRTTRPALSPAARALRLQRIFARLQEGASYKGIAAHEGLSRERLRQIVGAATARRGHPPDHKKMQFARLATPGIVATQPVAAIERPMVGSHPPLAPGLAASAAV